VAKNKLVINEKGEINLYFNFHFDKNGLCRAVIISEPEYTASAYKLYYGIFNTNARRTYSEGISEIDGSFEYIWRTKSNKTELKILDILRK
jgi:hypothetical protein